MQAAWALIKMYDLHNEVDVFKAGKNQIPYKLEMIKQDNVDFFAPLAETVKWNNINFKKFSRYHNKGLSEYQFNVQSVISQLKWWVNPNLH